MSNVSLEIAGRKFTVACAPGEEAHIEKLGRMIDGKVAEMPGLASQSEARCLLYAALLLADELHEARAGGGAPAASGPSLEVAQGLEAMASRLEDLAQSLEAGD
jgi:cell division protein ZapA